MFTPLEKVHAHTTLRAPLAVAWVGWMSVLLLAASGCRTARDNQFDILERELRTQEDYIYELEDYVVEYSEKLRQCRCSQPVSITTSHSESNSVVKQLKPADDDDQSSKLLRFDEQPLYESEDDSPEQREPDRPQSIELEETIPEDFEIPEVEIGEPLGQVEDAPVIEQAVYYQDEKLVTTEDELLLIPEPVAQDEQVVAVEHQINTPPKSADRVVVAQLFRSEAGKTPPKTLLAVVEARNTNDESVEFFGEVSLMVMTVDSEKPQRLKRWDFNPEDAASAWQSSHLGEGFHLELPLGETELPEVPLELWVRIVSQDGRKLLTQLSFEREQLTALEVETGARELVATLQDAVAEDESLVAEEQVDLRSGWQPATEWVDMDPQGNGSAIKKTSGWVSQPAGGRFPHALPTMSQAEQRSASTSGSGPVWKTGHEDRTPQATAHRGSQTQWLLRR